VEKVGKEGGTDMEKVKSGGRRVVRKDSERLMRYGDGRSGKPRRNGPMERAGDDSVGTTRFGRQVRGWSAT
jgi:hypothetical protein